MTAYRSCNRVEGGEGSYCKKSHSLVTSYMCSRGRKHKNSTGENVLLYTRISCFPLARDEPLSLLFLSLRECTETFCGIPTVFWLFILSHTALRKGKEIVKQRQSLTSFVKTKLGRSKDFRIGAALVNFKKCVRLLLRKLSFWLLLASNPTAIHIFCSTYKKPFSVFHSPYSVRCQSETCALLVRNTAPLFWQLEGFLEFACPFLFRAYTLS